MIQIKKCTTMLLAALLIGSAGTAFAGTSCGTNLEYELVGTVLRLTSPAPASPATILTEAFKNNTTITSVTLPENVWQIGSVRTAVSAVHLSTNLLSTSSGPAPVKGADEQIKAW